MTGCQCPTRQETQLGRLQGDHISEVVLRCLTCGGEVNGLRMIAWEAADEAAPDEPAVVRYQDREAS